MPPRNIQREGRIALALQAMELDSKLGIRKALRLYNVPYSTLYNRKHKRATRQEAQEVQQKLTKTEEQCLIDWVLSMDKRGFPPRIDHLRQLANLLLKSRDNININDPPTVRKC